MKKLILSIAVLGAAFSPVLVAPAFAGNGFAGAAASEGRYENRQDRRGAERRQVSDNRWESRHDRRDDRWDRREDRRDDRWDRRNDRRDDRWDRRNDRRDYRSDWRDDRRHDRWDRRHDRRHSDWGYRGWDRGRHNGYYYRDTWYYGAPPRSYYGDRYYRPDYRRWERGYYAPTYYRSHVVYDYHRHGLRHPPRGYRWVRADHDYLLIAIATGLIADVIINSY
jgi:Ni/Co efflux regulator RcnB